MLKLIEKNSEHKAHVLLDGKISSFGVVTKPANEWGAAKYKKGDWLIHLTGACRYKGGCENKVLPLVHLSELYREEKLWKKIHQETLLSIAAAEPVQNRGDDSYPCETR